MDSMTSLMRRLRDLETRINQTGAIDRNRAVVARAATAAGQSINNNAVTIIDYGAVTFDPDAQITTGAAWKFTATLPGYYRVSAAVTFASSTAWAAGEVGDLRIHVDGTLWSLIDRDDEMVSTTTAQLKFLSGTDIVYLAAGSYLDIRVYQLSGGAITLFTDTVLNHVAINKIN